jgi:NAD(P)-dependent dehydrogenase (short-subunit alcohol dehydrogenase family)
MGRLDGKVAIITGAGAGMGRAAAILFAREGAKVVIACRTIENGEETVRIIKEADGEAIFIKTDVSKTEDVKRMIYTTVDTYGKLDILFNNAGILGDGSSTVECTEENFNQLIGTNLKGVWLGMKYAIPEMLKSGGGAIINNASIAADRALANSAVYSASKGGVVALSRTAAIEYSRRNIRINCINPGSIATDMVLNLSPEFKEAVLAVTPRNKFAKPEEVAQAALFLASEECPHIIGQALVVDGGLEADSHLGTCI